MERGLLELFPDVEAGRIRGPRVLELEDALDDLERLAVPAGYPESTKTIASLRVELGKNHPVVVARPVPERLKLDAALAAQAGELAWTRERTALVGGLEIEEAALRADARERLAKLPEHTANDALEAAAKLVDADGACPPPADTRTVRALTPPRERRLVCQVLRVAASAASQLEATISAVVLHDDVAIALWAIALDAGATDTDATRTARPLLSSVPPNRQDRLVRSALVSPVYVIAPGIAATLLDAEGPGARSERAARWLAFGDAPFDIVANVLGRVPSSGASP